MGVSLSLPLVPPAGPPPSCRGGCERAAGEINKDRVLVQVCAGAKAKRDREPRRCARHIERVQCGPSERGGKGNSIGPIGKDLYPGGRSVERERVAVVRACARARVR